MANVVILLTTVVVLSALAAFLRVPPELIVSVGGVAVGLFAVARPRGEAKHLRRRVG